VGTEEGARLLGVQLGFLERGEVSAPSGEPVERHVHEVEATERHAEVGKSGECRLLRRPVETVRPVGDEFAQIGQA
jgi:hypothetical protein